MRARPPDLLTRGFVLLMLAHLIQATGWSSALLLPLFLEHVGASRQTIGEIMASGAIGGLLARPAVGWALDAWGRRSTVVVGTVLVAVAMGLLGLETTLSWRLWGLRLLFGAGAGALFTGYFTWAADLIPPERRTEGIALFGVTGLVPLAVNPMAELFGFGGAQVTLFIGLMGGVMLLSLAPLIWVPDEHHRGPESLKVTTTHVLRERRLRPAWWGTAVFASCVMVYMAFALVVAEKRGVAHTTAFWWTYAAGAVLVRLLGARIPDRLGPYNLFAPAMAASLAGLMTLAATTQVEGLLIAGALGGLGHGIGFPVLTAQIAERSPAAARGRAMATFTGLWDLCGLISAPCLGALADFAGDRVMLLSTVLASVCGITVWAWLEHRTAVDATHTRP